MNTEFNEKIVYRNKRYNFKDARLNKFHNYPAIFIFNKMKRRERLENPKFNNWQIYE